MYGVWSLPSEGDAVGACQPAFQNANGAMLRDMCNRHHLCLVNTFFQHGSGDTWHGMDGRSSRIDYVIMPKSLLTAVSSCNVWRKTGFQLQLAHVPRLVDHSPVVVDFMFRSWFEDVETKKQRCDVSALIADCASDVSEMQIEMQQWAGRPDVQQQLTTAISEQHTELVWSLLSSAVRDTANKLFPSQLSDCTMLHSSETITLANTLRDFKNDIFQNFTAASEINLSAAFSIWHSVTHLCKLARDYQYARRRDKRKAHEQLACQLSEALEQRDWHQVWKLTRRLAGTHLGPKRREYGITDGTTPSVSDWCEHLAKPGSQGGALTTTCFIDTKAIDVEGYCLRIFSQQQRQQQQPEQQQQQQLFPPQQQQQTQQTLAQQQQQQLADEECPELDMVAVIDALKAAKPYREVPRWSATREAWLASFGRGPDRSDNPFVHFFRVFLAMMYRQQQQPQIWSISETALLPKRNGKQGCAGFRVLHLLDPIGKAYNRRLWRSHTARHSANSLGFVANRRREQVVVQIQCLMWKLRRVGYSAVAALFDVANAFPSPNHRCLDKAIASKRFMKPEGNMLSQRHRTAHCVLRDHTGAEALLKNGCGDMQWDSVAPEKFTLIYEPLVHAWHSRTRSSVEKTGILTAIDPVCGELVDLSFAMFADDLARIGICDTVEHAIRRLNAWDFFVNIELDKRSMAQNTNKKEVLYQPSGAGAVQQMCSLQAAFRDGTVAGVLRKAVCYLGTQIQMGGGATIEIQTKLRKAAIAWRSLGSFWSNGDVSLRLRRFVYLTSVRSVLVSGLISAVLSSSDVLRLERFQNRCARRLLRGQATNFRHDHPVSLSNNEVRAKLKVPSITSVLFAQRIAWLKSIALHPEDNTVLLAAVFGSSPLDVVDDWSRDCSWTVVQSMVETVVARP
ncbi:unnamed protein product [Polarella glacialis]|uniref:Reverse transcriptase domain-containing protein n=1 Tax=Polarella glacialis TaxID=89957 RepID=A0A813IP22_POLGL|nr:unnamed protein product [Polarella glacialis]